MCDFEPQGEREIQMPNQSFTSRTRAYMSRPTRCGSVSYRILQAPPPSGLSYRHCLTVILESKKVRATGSGTLGCKGHPPWLHLIIYALSCFRRIFEMHPMYAMFGCNRINVKNREGIGGHRKIRQRWWAAATKCTATPG